MAWRSTRVTITTTAARSSRWRSTIALCTVSARSGSVKGGWTTADSTETGSRVMRAGERRVAGTLGRTLGVERLWVADRLRLMRKLSGRGRRLRWMKEGFARRRRY